MHNPNLVPDTQEFYYRGRRITLPIKPSVKQPELDPQVAAVLGAADGCPYTALKVTEAVVLALRPLNENTSPTFPALALLDKYLITCGTALVDSLKAVSTTKPTDHDRILLLAGLLEETDTNDILSHTDHATALLNDPRFQQLLKIPTTFKMNKEPEQLKIDLVATNEGFEATVSDLKLHCAANPRSACLAAAAKLEELALKFKILAKQDGPLYSKSVLKRVNSYKVV